MRVSTSDELFARASNVIPGGVDSPVRAFGAVGGTPRFVDHGAGAFLTDVDGVSYVDYVQSWGALLFGHARAEIVEAATAAAARGTSFGAPTSLEVELAERIVDAVPGVDMVRLVSSGTEATMSAIRLARGVDRTRPAREVRGLLPRSLRRAARQGCRIGRGDARHPRLAGRDRGSGRETRSPRRSTTSDAVRSIFAERGADVAVVIVEPIAANMGVVPPEDGFLEGLRDLCDEHGALLCLRRGDHRVPGRVRRRGLALRGDARPDDARQDHGRRVPVRGVRRTPRA